MSTLKQQLKSSVSLARGTSIAMFGTQKVLVRRPLAIEVQMGIPARYIVHYTRNGKPFVDGLFGMSVKESRQQFVDGCKELKWRNVEIVRIVKA